MPGHIGVYVALLLLSTPAGAMRFAIVAANNAGWGNEARLSFAHDDAERLSLTLRELGGFQAKNVLYLPHASPASIRNAIDTAKAALSQPGRHLLLFYYSGHADTRGIHPGRAQLSYERLRQLMREVPSDIRIALLDSCQSGALTQLKGRPGPAFDIRQARFDRVHGEILITSASATENAQEAYRLRGSFFTNHLNAGMRGAADSNHDGKVTLGELYAFAYTHTVGSTLGTRGGTQHPAHRFDMHGRGEVILSYPLRAKACVIIPESSQDSRYVVLTEGERAVAEVSSRRKQLKIGLPAGTYRVRQSIPAGLFEQRLQLLAGECRRIRREHMHRIILPSTLSKGDLLRQTWSLYAGYVAALGRLSGTTLPVHGLALALRIPLGENWAIRPNASYTHGGFAGEQQQVTSNVWGLGLAGTYDWATALGLLAAGPTAEFQLVQQQTALPNSRTISTLRAGALLRYALPLPIWRLSLAAEVKAGYAAVGLGAEIDHRAMIDIGAGVQAWF